MGANHLIVSGGTKFDLREDTVNSDVLVSGYTAHGADGEQIVGTLEVEYNWKPHDGMPDLMSVDLSSVADCVLWTYDANDSDLWISFKVTTKATVNLDCSLGTIVDGVFVAETQLTAKSNAEIRLEFPETQYDYPVLRILSSSPMYTVQSITSPTRGSGNISGQAQAIVDGRIKGTNITSLTSNRPFPMMMEHVTLENITKWTSFQGMFSQAANMRQIDFINCDTPKVTSMYQAFYYNRALRKITGYENFNTSKVTRMDYFMSGCVSIEKLDFRNWDVSNITTLAQAFNNCKGLSELLIDTWRPTKLTAMNSTFADCSSLEELIIPGWDIPLCTTFDSTFSNMTTLKRVVVTGWIVSGGTTFAKLFNNGYCLQELDLSTWTLPSLASKDKITQILYNMNGIHELKIPEGIEYAISLSYASLSQDSMDYLVEHLGTANGTQTITITNCKGKLTSEQMLVITEKGWTIA